MAQFVLCYKFTTRLMIISDIIQFIRANDIDHEGWSDNELAIGINNCIHGQGFGYVCDGTGKLKGIYMGKWTTDDTFEVFCLVGRGAMLSMLKQFKTKYPHVKLITGMRHLHQAGAVGKYSKLLAFREFEVGKHL